MRTNYSATTFYFKMHKKYLTVWLIQTEIQFTFTLFRLEKNFRFDRSGLSHFPRRSNKQLSHLITNDTDPLTVSVYNFIEWDVAAHPVCWRVPPHGEALTLFIPLSKAAIWRWQPLSYVSCVTLWWDQVYGLLSRTHWFALNVPWRCAMKLCILHNTHHSIKDNEDNWCYIWFGLKLV